VPATRSSQVRGSWRNAYFANAIRRQYCRFSVITHRFRRGETVVKEIRRSIEFRTLELASTLTDWRFELVGESSSVVTHSVEKLVCVSAS